MTDVPRLDEELHQHHWNARTQGHSQHAIAVHQPETEYDVHNPLTYSRKCKITVIVRGIQKSDRGHLGLGKEAAYGESDQDRIRVGVRCAHPADDECFSPNDESEGDKSRSPGRDFCCKKERAFHSSDVTRAFPLAENRL